MRRVTTLDQDIAAHTRECRECGESKRWEDIDLERYDFYSDLGEIVICRECSDEEEHRAQDV